VDHLQRHEALRTGLERSADGRVFAQLRLLLHKDLAANLISASSSADDSAPDLASIRLGPSSADLAMRALTSGLVLAI
jgi:hypothetical protein